MAMNPDIEEIQAAITSANWFQDLPLEAHEILIKSAKIVDYPSHSFIFTFGDITSDIYCLLSGRLRISVTSSMGQEFALTDLEAGAWLGEPAIVTGNTRLLDVLVQEPSRVLQIPCRIILQLAEEYPIIYKRLFFDHVTKTRGVYVLLSGTLFYPLHSRLAGRLLELAETHGNKTDEGIYLDVTLSQNDFAQLSMGSRQRINKILGRWRERDIVVMQEGQYLIKDLKALEEELELVDED